MVSFKLNYKLWLEKENKVFGPGPAALLEFVETYGSLHRAAGEMEMSYSQAWNLISTLETRLGFSLITSQAGGRGGGGSKLTEEGKKLLKRFREFEEQADSNLSRLAEKYFSQEFMQKLQEE